MTKKIVSVLTAFVIAVLCVFPVFAKNQNASIEIPQVTGKPGEKITVKINLKENSGIAGTRLGLIYNKAFLELTAVKNGAVFEDKYAMFGNDMNEVPFYLMWEDSLSNENNTESGCLAELEFTVKKNVTAEKTLVEIEVDDASTFDKDLKNVVIEDGKGTVIIEGNTASYQKENAAGTSAQNESEVNPAEVKTASNSSENSSRAEKTSDKEATKTSTAKNETNNNAAMGLGAAVAAVIAAATVLIILKKRKVSENEK